MFQHQLVGQFQRLRPQLRLLQSLLQAIDLTPLPIQMNEELILFFVNIGIPLLVALCHCLSEILNLSHCAVKLVNLSFQTIPLSPN